MKAGQKFPIYSGSTLVATLTVKKVYKVAVVEKAYSSSSAELSAVVNLDKKTIRILGFMIKTSSVINPEFNPFKDPMFKKFIRTEEKQPVNRLFTIGAEVEYDSYNLSYTGPIVNIGAKTVKIQGTSEYKQLKISEFCWRNYDLDLKKIKKSNAEWYD